MIVLVTGFGAFPGARRNPSAAILRALGRERRRFGRLGIDLRALHLPVAYGEIGLTLGAATASAKPDVILHLGLASRRREISIETRALNRANPLHPDATGQRPAPRLRRGGAMSLRATYPAARLLPAMRQVWPASARSIDAGDYVCNATLYASLADRLASLVGFIHVPRPRAGTQPCRRTRCPRPSLGTLTRAVSAAVTVCARDARLCRRAGAR